MRVEDMDRFGDVLVGEKVRNERCTGTETLQRRVHEARVTKIAKTSDA